MQKNSTIQTIIMIVFGVGVVVAVLLFANSSSNSNADSATLTVWGTEPADIMSPIIESVSTKAVVVQYAQQDAATFERTLLEALAAGTGPDLFLTSQEDALKYRKYTIEVPFQSYAKRTYQGTFISEADLFLTDTGVVAFPLFIDPMVLYYNRALLSSAFITTPPQYWDEFVALTPRLTRRTDSGSLLQSAIGFGTANNIRYTKEILAMLMLQAGNPVVAPDPQTGQLRSVVLNATVVSNAADSALRFFTSFADSAMQNYTWNTSLPESRAMFANGDLAFYVGFASELPIIRATNSNLNFDVTLIPQTRGTGITATYGKITGIAISRGTKNPNAALSVAAALASINSVSNISTQLGLPPVRRDLLGALNPNDASYLATFNNSAIISQGFPDPDTTLSREAFNRMVDNVNARLSDTYQAVQRLNTDLNSLLAPYRTTTP